MLLILSIQLLCYLQLVISCVRICLRSFIATVPCLQVKHLLLVQAATRHLDVGEEAAKMPFVLICGPPGTGKTHTVTGILNIWHLAHYTRHQNSIIDHMRAELAHGSIHSASGLESRCESTIGLSKMSF